MRRPLPARYTIERRSAPLSRWRFLSTAADGGRFWGAKIDSYASATAARAYHEQRMGPHAADAVVVAHTVH